MLPSQIIFDIHSFNGSDDLLIKILSSRGFNVQNIQRNNEIITSKVYRFKKTNIIDFYKTLKALKIHGVKRLDINKESLVLSNEFSIQENIFVGNGVRSYLELNNNIMTKNFFNSTDELEKEINTRELLSDIKNIVSIISHNKTSIEMPFYRNKLSWAPSNWYYYPLTYFSDIYKFMLDLYEAGFCMVDWNYNAFIFTDEGLKVIDLEYLYAWPADTPKLSISPDFTGKRHACDVPDKVICSFDTIWKSALGVSYKEYTTLSTTHLHCLRFLRLWTRLFPMKLYKLLENFAKKLKYHIFYKHAATNETIIISRRFK